MTPDSFAIAQETIDGTLMLRASGKFDRDTGLAIETKVKAHDGAGVVNLEGVEYISSSGIAHLVQLQTKHGARLACPAECVRDTLSLAGIMRILTLHDDEAAARAAEV